MSDQSTALTTTSGSAFSGIQAFEDAQRMAKSLASSTLVPPQFQGQNGFANCLVALEIASRMRMSPFVVVQNLHIIHGRPSWSSQFIIGLVNGCGRFSPLRYEMTGSGDSLACYCVATELSSGSDLKGPTVSMAMAKKEGWATKAGSKWQTMPELMIRYRAAAFWGRLYIPELLVGIQTEEEVVDVQPVTVRAAEPELPKASLEDLNQQIAAPVVITPKPAKEAATDDHEIF
jgi:hypothetical protein